MDRARQSIRSLMDIAPKEALVRRDGQEMMIHVESIAVGDIMIVKPGQKYCDGWNCRKWLLGCESSDDYRGIGSC